jgi:hypothetical protein
MQNMTITESMHQLFEGAVLHISAHTSAAIKLWKKGLSGRRVSDLMYVRELLHLLVAYYTESANNSNHNAHEETSNMRKATVQSIQSSQPVIRRPSRTNAFESDDPTRGISSTYTSLE